MTIKGFRIFLFCMLSLHMSLCISQNALSQTFQEIYNATTYITAKHNVGLVKGVYIHIVDNISGNCWTNANQVENRIRYRLTADGIKVFDEPLAFYGPKFPVVVFRATGYKTLTANLCVASIELEVSIPDTEIRFGSYENKNLVSLRCYPVMWFSGAALSNSNKLNDQIYKEVDSYMDRLIADILAARNEPSIVKANKKFFNNIEALTQSDLKEMISK